MSRRRAAALMVAAFIVVTWQACTTARGAVTDSVRADSITRARQDSINRAQPGYVIDSVLAPDEELRRFREAIGGAPAAAFRHASPSRDALARRAIAALSRADTADLRAMSLDVREFADLVFPSSPFARPPYRQPVGFAWQQIDGANTVAARRLVRHMGGRSWRYVDLACAPRVERQGVNAIWSACEARLVAPRGDTVRAQLFGSIIERDGQYKVGGFR